MILRLSKFRILGFVHERFAYNIEPYLYGFFNTLYFNVVAMNRKVLEDNCYTIFIVAITALAVMVAVVFAMFFVGLLYEDAQDYSANTAIVDRDSLIYE